MPLAEIEIIEFVGVVGEERESRPVQTYLVLIDGEFRLKRGRPALHNIPQSWRDRFLVESFDVGRNADWREFANACAERMQSANRTNGESVPPPIRTASGAGDSLPPVPAAAAPPGLDGEVRRILDHLLSEPLERLVSLKFEVMGYLSLIESGSAPFASADQAMARRVAGQMQAVVARALERGVSPDEHRRVQATVRYFTVADDAIPDWEERGYEDDVAVLNHMVTSLGWTDLVLSVDGE